LQERLDLATELATLTASLDDTRGRYYAALVGIGPALEAGDLALVDRRIAAAAALADGLREPPLRWFVLLPCASRATITGDLDEAAGVLHDLAADDFAAVPDDLGWLATMVACADMCATLGDVDVAEQVRTRLLPYREHCATVASAVWWGPVEHYLGLLAVV